MMIHSQSLYFQLRDFSRQVEWLASFALFQNDEIERELFTFDKFSELYRKICPRTDVEQLFSEM